VLAGFSALHNASSRYLFALGRENIAPHIFGGYHKDFFSPHIASLAITGITSGVTISFMIGSADPYKIFAASLIAVGTLGIVCLQAFASLSVVVFFWKRKDRKLWESFLAPIIGFVGLLAAFVLAAMHYNTLTGSNNRIVNLVPLTLIIVVASGIINGLRIRKINLLFMQSSLLPNLGLSGSQISLSRKLNTQEGTVLLAPVQLD